MREFKDSGNIYIKEIPKDWGVVKIKNTKDINHPYPIGDGDHGQISPSDYLEEGIPYIRVQNLSWGKDLKLDDVVYISDEINEANKKSILRPHDILVAKTGATIGKTAIIPNDIPMANTTSSVGKISVSDRYDYRFVFYCLISDVCFQQMWRKAEQKSAQPGFNIIDLEEFIIPMPPTKDIQSRLSDYLDSKCSKIDEIIAKQEQIIEKLKEYKLSVITQAVTKGLNPDVEMKDSRDLRIGYIPISWDKVKITRILDYSCPYPIGDGDHGLIKTNDYKDEGIPYIRVQNLGWGTDLLLDNVVYISEEDHNRIIGSELHPKDVLFCKTGATIGKTGMIPDSIPISNTTSHVGKISIDARYNARFVFYYLSSFIGYEQFWDIACLKSTRPELSIEEIKRINISIPNNKSEQDEIVHYLDNVCVQIDNRINKSISICEKLKEYKKSLIYEVVTGKKEV